MKKGRTASPAVDQEVVPEFPGWYVNFQVAVLQQLPRPGKIIKEVAEAFGKDQRFLKRILYQGLSAEGLERMRMQFFEPPCMKQIGAVVIPGLQVFAPRNWFVTSNGFVRIVNISQSFSELFLMDDRYVHGSTTTPSHLWVNDLLIPHDSLDIALTFDGNLNRLEVGLNQLFHLMTLQPDGGPGHLQVETGIANLFCVRIIGNPENHFALVSLTYNRAKNGWCLDAEPPEGGPIKWPAGTRVFSGMKV